MKKYFSFLFLFLALCISISACGADSIEGVNVPDESTHIDSTDTNSSELPTETIVPETAPSTSLVPSPIPSEENNPLCFAMRGSIDETILVDEAGIKIIATNLVYSDHAAELIITIENNRENKISLYSGGTIFGCNSVNGYMVDDGFLQIYMEPGERREETLVFEFDSLGVYGIREIAEFEIGFVVKEDNNDYEYFPLVTLKTSIADSYDYSQECFFEGITRQSSQRHLQCSVENLSVVDIDIADGVSIVSKAEIIYNYNDGFTRLFLECENTTNHSVTLTAANISINGITVGTGAYASEMLNPGKKGLLVIMISELVDEPGYNLAGLDKPNNIHFLLRFRDNDTQESSEKALSFLLNGALIQNDFSGDVVYSDSNFIVYFLGSSEDYLKAYNLPVYHFAFVIENNSSAFVTVYGFATIDEEVIGQNIETCSVNEGAHTLLIVEVPKASGIPDFTKEENYSAVTIMLYLLDSRNNTLAEPVITFGK